MNPAYKETFARHRLLFCLPVVLAAVVSLLFVLGAPKVYQAETALWVDNPPPGPSSLDQNIPGALSPAAQAQEFLNELLATRGFRLAVGEHGGLKKYLAAHSSAGFSPKALLEALRGKEPLDNQVVAALDGKHVASTVAGPQILAISFRGPDPGVAANTLWALKDQLNLERVNLDVQRAKESVNLFQRRVNAATQALQDAASPQDAAVASAQIKAAARGLNQWRLILAAATHEGQTFEVRQGDEPKPPTGPVSGKKKALFAIVGGLFVGALVSFLGIVVLSGREERPRARPLQERVEESLGHDAPASSEVDWLPSGSGLEYQANGSNGSHEGSPEVERPTPDVDHTRD